MKKASRYLQLTLSVFWLLQTFIWLEPVQAATRNDFLFNLKDTLNSPVSGRSSIASIILSLLVCALVIWLIYYYASKEKKEQQTAHKLHQEKLHMQRTSSPQKRNWYRYKTKGEFMWIPAEQEENVNQNRFKRDHLIDVSGGGLCFSTAEKLAKGDDIKLILSLGQGNSVSLYGQVIRVVEDAGINTVSIEYTDIRDGQRDRIVSWILNNQRSNINNQKAEENKPNDTE